MIPSQQAMMLDSALAFEKIIKNPKAGAKASDGKVQITWDNPEELETYIGKLQAAADRLTSENRRLRKCHNIVCEKVCGCIFHSRLHNLILAYKKSHTSQHFKADMHFI